MHTTSMQPFNFHAVITVMIKTPRFYVRFKRHTIINLICTAFESKSILTGQNMLFMLYCTRALLRGNGAKGLQRV